MRGNTFRPFGGDQVAVVGVDDARHDARAASPTRSSSTFRRWRPRSIACAARSSPTSAATRCAPRFSCRRARRARAPRVPLEVPVRCTCHACGGRGETWTEACRRCRGSGIELLRHQLQVLGARRRRRRRALPLHRDPAPQSADAHRAARSRRIASWNATSRLLGILRSLWGALAMLVGVVDAAAGGRRAGDPRRARWRGRRLRGRPDRRRVRRRSASSRCSGAARTSGPRCSCAGASRPAAS